MPRGNGTGPRGMGRSSGRGAGFCAGYDMPGFSNPVLGRGFGMGVGRGGGFPGGRGWRNCFFATGLPGSMRFGGGNAVQDTAMRPDPEMEKQALRAQVEGLETELDFVKKRLAAMGSGADEGQ
jgi:uncharacterized membrane protein